MTRQCAACSGQIAPPKPAMFRPLSERLAPKRAQCHYCGSGCERQDPAVLIRLFGGDKVP